ncbi:MAG: hypothetical protein HYR50_00310 [Candidatus Rokubacteria bacterium]|nr:hypothetical protein [Candidatus Rokubacteria bacterium]
MRCWPAVVGISMLLQSSPSWALSYDRIIKYQGITYESWHDRGWNGAEGRPLTEADLDRLVTLVECDISTGDASRLLYVLQVERWHRVLSSVRA